MQTAIPFLLMRGGTSRGPYLNRADLPADRETLAEVLLAMLGSGHPLNIDGIGGGVAVTTKVAMLSRSDDPWADIDYVFAQLGVEDRRVDFRPTCGNILSGVGPAAIEMGLVEPTGDVTEVRIHAVNSKARVAARVRTPGGAVSYEGDARLDGVPGTAAPVELMFRDVVGGATGSMFPTGNRIDRIDGMAVTCLDIAMPMVIARAGEFGLTARESAAELDAKRAFRTRMELIRVEAGRRMGMGDVSGSVTPKFGIVAPPVAGGHMLSRYFMPKDCHPSMSLTGAQCLAACLLCPGTVAEGIAETPDTGPLAIRLEHPAGMLEVILDYRRDGGALRIVSAGAVRTARKLASGEIFVPGRIWAPG